LVALGQRGDVGLDVGEVEGNAVLAKRSDAGDDLAVPPGAGQVVGAAVRRPVVLLAIPPRILLRLGRPYLTDRRRIVLRMFASTSNQLHVTSRYG
jgi:hypothetical protein